MIRQPSDGYVTDASYADTFFRELSPAWINYAAAVNGGAPRALEPSFTYLELGCGFGGSTVVNAGAFPQGEFHACDLNPAHIDGGRRHAEALGIGNVQLHEASFEQILAMDLPVFDFITLHGVYSWVGAESRRAIRQVLLEKLKPGGLAYVSYNCLPGWSVEVPLRKLLFELAATSEGASPERAGHGLSLLHRLSAGKLRYFTANPSAVTAVDAYVRGSSRYLAHEFMNQVWEPFYSVDVADEMAGVGLSYVGSATLADNHPALVVDSSAAEALAALETERQRALAVDFAVNRRFRRDVFVRGGPVREPPAVPYLDAVPVGASGDPAAIAVKARVPRGEIAFQEAFIRELRALMDEGSMPFGRIVEALSVDGRHAGEIARNVTFLVAAGTLMPYAKAHRSTAGVTLKRQAAPLVERSVAFAIERLSRIAIPSDVLGNGVTIEPVEALGLAEWLAGVDDEERMAVRLEAAGRDRGLAIAGDRNAADGSPADLCRGAARRVLERLVPTLRRLDLIR
jgi:hypothetical protein